MINFENTIYYTIRNDFLQVIFESIGCRFRKMGYCNMCNYGGNEFNTPKEKAISFLHDILSKRKFNRILIGTSGSILDRSEMRESVLISILDVLNKDPYIQNVMLETHYITVNERKLSYIKKIIPNKNVYIEMGLESCNEFVLKNYINKFLNINDLKETIKLIKSFDIYPVLNVLLGAPYLSEKEQIKDTYDSVLWSFENGAEEVVILPCNIKPDTQVYELYLKKEYKPVTHLQILELLNKIPYEYLSRITLSWYGNFQCEGEETFCIPPSFPNIKGAKNDIMNFYKSFMSDFNNENRKRFITEICNKFNIKGE